MIQAMDRRMWMDLSLVTRAKDSSKSTPSTQGQRCVDGRGFKWTPWPKEENKLYSVFLNFFVLTP